MRMTSLKNSRAIGWVLAAFGMGVLGVAGQVLAAAPQCTATTQSAATVVELYTSEGCSSCPPADRWLSTLKGRPDVLALAFHVNYWDRLGWPDRFASAEATERQHLLASAARSSTVYTPQIVVNGRDERSGLNLAGKTLAPASAQLTLAREGGSVVARLSAGTTATRLAGYWAVLEDKHQTKVRAGENSGETLLHDHVVRLYKPVAPWTGDKAFSSQLSISAGDAANPRRAAFVVVDPATQRPLQAATLALPAGC